MVDEEPDFHIGVPPVHIPRLAVIFIIYYNKGRWLQSMPPLVRLIKKDDVIMKERKPVDFEIDQDTKQIRENAGLTQGRPAGLTNLGVKHPSTIECGTVGMSLATLKQLCVLLFVLADVILFGIGSSNGEAEWSVVLQFLTDRLSHLPNADFWVIKEILDKLLEAMAKSR